jgi:hypothetical protein
VPFGGDDHKDKYSKDSKIDVSHGGNGGSALGFSMDVKGGDAGDVKGGDGNHAGHTGTNVGSALSSSDAHLEAFNSKIFLGANTQQISLDATQNAEVCPCPDNAAPSAATSGHNVAADLCGTAVAVDGSGNNNDHNSVLSFNDAFDNLVNLPCANVCDLDGMLSAKGVLQILGGGGNQFANDQIQNIVDNDCASASYHFDNCECPIQAGYGGDGCFGGVGGDGGNATGFTMSVTGGNAGVATGGSNNYTGFDGTGVGSASASSSAHLEAFNQNIIMGANFQSEALTHAQTVTIDHVTG